MPGKPFENWLSRHRNPTNFWIHMIAIPVTFLLPILLAALGHFLLAAVSFVLGYALQFAGHLVEGNRSGEENLVRKLLSKNS
ncbi:MAG: Mpo1-like protein [Phycisphaerae bacterium]